MSNTITLDPADPFEAALIRMVRTNRAKRSDYTLDPKGGPFWNFERTAEQLGLHREQVVEVFIATKQARLQALTTSGRPAQNEAVEDTILDRAVYAVISLAMLDEKSVRPVKPHAVPNDATPPGASWDDPLPTMQAVPTSALTTEKILLPTTDEFPLPGRRAAS